MYSPLKLSMQLVDKEFLKRILFRVHPKALLWYLLNKLQWRNRKFLLSNVLFSCPIRSLSFWLVQFFSEKLLKEFTHRYFNSLMKIGPAHSSLVSFSCAIQLLHFYAAIHQVHATYLEWFVLGSEIISRSFLLELISFYLKCIHA